MASSTLPYIHESSKTKPELNKIIPQPFKPEKPGVSVIIPPPRVTTTGISSYTGDHYQDILLLLDIEFKNISTKPVSEFGAQIKLPKFLIVDRSNYKTDGDWIIIEKQIERKLFGGQTISAEQIKFEINI